MLPFRDNHVMTPDPAASPVPPAFNGNPIPSHATADNTGRTSEAAERIASLLGQLPQAIGMMLGQVVRAIPSQHLCAQCLVDRIGWEALHRRELEAAIEKGREAHGIPEGAPLPPGFDPAPFLPKQLQPGGPQEMPNLTASITIVNGGRDVLRSHSGTSGQDSAADRKQRTEPVCNGVAEGCLAAEAADKRNERRQGR
jgi:hypothetical protein